MQAARRLYQSQWWRWRVATHSDTPTGGDDPALGTSNIPQKFSVHRRERGYSYLAASPWKSDLYIAYLGLRGVVLPLTTRIADNCMLQL